VIDELSLIADPKKLAPHQRSALLQWCERCASRSPIDIAGSARVPLVQLGLKTIADADKDIRAAASALVRSLHSAAARGGDGVAGGAKAASAVLDLVKTLDKKTQLKITSQPGPGGGGDAPAGPDSAASSPTAAAGTGASAASARGQASSSSGASGRAASAGGGAAAASDRPGTATVAKRSSRTAASSDKSATGGGSVSATASTTANTSSSAASSVSELTIDIPSAEVAAAKLIEAGVIDSDAAEGIKPLQNMGVAKWSERVDAMRLLRDAFSGAEAGASDEGSKPTNGDANRFAEEIVTLLACGAKGFKESNANVLGALFDAVRVVAAVTAPPPAPGFSRSAAKTCIVPAVAKLTDKKLAAPACMMLSALAEAIEPSFVLSLVMAELSKARSPQAHVEALQWAHALVTDFGAAVLSPSTLARFCAEECENKSGLVRAAAVKLVGALHYELGPQIRTAALTESTPAAVTKAFESEFEATGYNPNAASGGQGGSNRKVAKGLSASAAAEAAAAVALPDLASLMSEGTLAGLASTTEKNAWQIRKAAMDEVRITRRCNLFRARRPLTMLPEGSPFSHLLCHHCHVSFGWGARAVGARRVMRFARLLKCARMQATRFRQTSRSSQCSKRSNLAWRTRSQTTSRWPQWRSQSYSSRSTLLRLLALDAWWCLSSSR
jgi:hypothetical protein